MKRTCLDCQAPISSFSKGRCRKCAAAALNADRAVIERRTIAILGHLPRPAPDDFATFAPGKAESLLADHYGATRKIVRRWRKELGVKSARSGAPMSIPDDFAVMAAAHRSPALAERYGVSQRTINRWRVLTGVEVQKPAGTVVKASKLPAAPKPRKLPTDMLVIKQNSAVVQQQTRNIRVPPPDRSSAEARAAEVLRRLVQTYRCDERGRMNPRGQFWRHGNVVLTPDEMMQRAERHGWREAA